MQSIDVLMRIQKHYILVLLLHTSKWIRGSCEHQDVCDNREFVVNCDDNEAILIEKATFGRMAIGKCVHTDFGYIGCENDVLNLVDRWCSGLQHCLVEVSNDELDKANTACSPDLNSYLDVDYTCIPVTTPVKSCSAQSSISVRNRLGHISSHVTAETGCGSPRTPWVIEAQSGQTIDLWLIDFGALDREEQSLYTSCHQLYGFIIERDLGVNLTMCGGTERKRHLYKSKTNKVEVHMLSQLKDNFRYLVQYTFVGCSDLTPPAHAWYKREDYEAVIGCKSNDKIWRLYCKGNTWDGVVGNCSKKEEPGKGSRTTFMFTFSSVILLTSVVCGAVLLIIIVIVGGSVYVKKQRIKHELKLRSDYGMLSQDHYYTLKSGYGINTMTSANIQLPGDSQPLVHIADKDAMDTSTSQSDCVCGTMSRSLAIDQPIKNETRSSRGNLL